MLWFAEKGEPGPAGGGEAQHQSPEDSGGEDEKADAERGVLEKEGGGGALEDGDEVRKAPSCGKRERTARR